MNIKGKKEQMIYKLKIVSLKSSFTENDVEIKSKKFFLINGISYISFTTYEITTSQRFIY